MIFTKKDKRTNLEKEIDSVLLIMSGYSPASTEYTSMMNNLEKLYKARDDEKSRRVKPDTLWVVGGNLVGVFGMLYYERINIITSKVLGHIVKGRA